MLLRTDPFGEPARLAPLTGPATWSKPSAMPMDAYREGDGYVVASDIPGITAYAIGVGADAVLADSLG